MLQKRQKYMDRSEFSGVLPTVKTGNRKRVNAFPDYADADIILKQNHNDGTSGKACSPPQGKTGRLLPY